jgi:uncharacterized protein DUF4192
LALAPRAGFVTLPDMTTECSFPISAPAEFVAVTPYVLGFHPSDSLVVVGVLDRRVIFAARYDLPPPGRDDGPGIAMVIAAQLAASVVVIGYGRPTAVTPAVLRLVQALEAKRVEVIDAIRVTDGRWWSYRCDVVGCCPDEGTPCGDADSLVAAQAVFRGQVALPNRQALVDRVASVQGDARAAMAAAERRARARLAGSTGDGGRPDRTDRWVRRAGRTAVRDAERRYRSGRSLTDDETAWLGLLLLDPTVNEWALNRCDGQDWRVRLWTDVLRRVGEVCVPTAACLLGLAAWQAGQGALARVAVDRALRLRPEHRMAGLLDDILALGVSPNAAESLTIPSSSRTAPARSTGR